MEITFAGRSMIICSAGPTNRRMPDRAGDAPNSILRSLEGHGREELMGVNKKAGSFDPAFWRNYKSYLVALSVAGALSAGAAAAVVLLPSLVRRGKNGVTSNGILSRIEV